ncbi:MAG: hypothetical protein LBH75_04160 [Treponema sp.]|jgi:hypothetical protein|nr:hypothetical protein [Treponema sp.]
MVTKYNKRVILENEDRRMAREDAWAILNNSTKVALHVRSNGETAAVKLGKFHAEYQEGTCRGYYLTPMKEEEARAYWIEDDADRRSKGNVI